MTRHSLRSWAVLSLLIGGSILFFIPFLWTLSTALKSSAEIASDPTRLIPLHPHPQNFPDAWRALPFSEFVLNTLFITLVNTFGVILSSSLVAYGFARFRFRGSRSLFALLLGTMMLPSQVTMVPVYLIWRATGSIDTFLPLTLPAYLGGGAFNIFLLRQFFLTIPYELDEAMILDGANYFTIWRKLMIPLSGPAIATVTVFTLLGNWDNFEGPLIYLNSPEKYPVSIGLRMFQDSFGTNMGQLMSASLIHILPAVLVFLFAQRYFVKGIVTSGLGGK